LDGGSQLSSSLPFLPDWFPARESTPLLRVVTGALFGITTAWFLYPYVEESMRETRALLARKFARAGKPDQAQK
jgi:peptidoglycan/LPS O-acetylase OafA/YrhL